MPICHNCHKQWNWKQTVQKMFTLDTGMICPHCEKKQFLTTRSRKRSSITVFFAPFVMLVGIVIDLSPVTTLILLAASFFVAIAVHPFLVEFTDEEEPLW